MAGTPPFPSVSEYLHTMILPQGSSHYAFPREPSARSGSHRVGHLVIAGLVK